MTQPPIKAQIIARVIELCQVLIARGNVRKIERAHALFLLEAIKPALHVIVGDESVIGEDNHGYIMQFPLALEFIYAETRDPEGKGDQNVALVQEQIETDTQLSALANQITYNGCQNFLENTNEPDCMVVVNYVVQYRRARQKPDVNY